MPQINFICSKVLSIDTKRELVKGLTAAVSRAMEAAGARKRKRILSVWFKHVAPDDFATDGVLIVDGSPPLVQVEYFTFDLTDDQRVALAAALTQCITAILAFPDVPAAKIRLSFIPYRPEDFALGSSFLHAKDVCDALAPQSS